MKKRIKDFLEKAVRNPIGRIFILPVLRFYFFLKSSRIQFFKCIPRYNEDDLLTANHPVFMEDEWFMDCYNSAVKEGLAVSDKIHWRAHVACWAGFKAMGLEGDFVECGVYKGFLSKIVMDYIKFRDSSKNFYLLDTYEGVSEKYLTKKEREKILFWGYDLCSSYEDVKKTFKDYKNVKIIKGTVPDTLVEVNSDKIAYLSIDMNCTMPEIAAAEYFWDKLVEGAVVLLDDYGHSGYEEQRFAFDEFAKRKNVSILCFPTGQGLMIKP